MRENADAGGFASGVETDGEGEAISSPGVEKKIKKVKKKASSKGAAPSGKPKAKGSGAAKSSKAGSKTAKAK